MIVDVNVHWKPDILYTDKDFLDSCVRCAPRAWGAHVEIRDIPGPFGKAITISQPKGYENINGETASADSDDRLRAMDQTGVDKAILRWPIWPEWMTLENCRKVNDAMARTTRQHPDRFYGLAMVPPWGDDACLKELDRCINELGCVGVELTAHYGQLYLDAEVFRPYLAKINQMKIPICVHHTFLPVEHNSIYEYVNLRRLFGRCMDQAICASRIMFSGLLEEFPNLKFIHTMMAGGLYNYIDLITPQKSSVKGDRERFDPGASDKVRQYFAKNIYCDMTHPSPWGKEQLECGIKIHGADHVLFGSSYPLRSEWLYKGLDYVRSLNISENDKALILGDNAARLFNLKG